MVVLAEALVVADPDQGAAVWVHVLYLSTTYFCIVQVVEVEAEPT